MDERLLAVAGGVVGGALVVLLVWERLWTRALAGQRPQY